MTVPAFEMFECSECHHVESTRLARFWTQQLRQRRAGVPVDAREFRCSKCATGAWHGRFPREHVDAFLAEFPDAELLWRPFEPTAWDG